MYYPINPNSSNSPRFADLCSILDGYSRYIVHWEIREKVREADVEIIFQRAKEKFPDNSPHLISNNGPPFIAKDFKEFIRIGTFIFYRPFCKLRLAYFYPGKFQFRLRQDNPLFTL